MKKTIRDFLSKIGPEVDIAGVGDNESLLDAGIVDSVVMVDLIEFLEGHFTIRIDEDELVPENFDTIESMAKYVDEKTGGSHSP